MSTKLTRDKEKDTLRIFQADDTQEYPPENQYDSEAKFMWRHSKEKTKDWAKIYKSENKKELDFDGKYFKDPIYVCKESLMIYLPWW